VEAPSPAGFDLSDDEVAAADLASASVIGVPEYSPGEGAEPDDLGPDLDTAPHDGTRRGDRPAAPPAELTPQGNHRSPVAQSEELPYRLPSQKLLKRADARRRPSSKDGGREASVLVETLSHFNVDARVIGTVTGPHVTRFELRLAPGTKMSKIAQLRDDLAYALAAEDVRILAPIPGKQAVGVEVPNQVRRTVHLGDVFQEAPSGWSPLTVWLGEDIAGKSIGADLAKQPHVLVAGTTGSGKSGCVNAMLASILLRATPNEVRVVLVDPKQVELNLYEGIPHLLTPVVTSPRLAANVLGNLIKEMEARYSVMSRARSRNLVELNKVRAREGEPSLPYILCVIDELADLMMIAPGEVEDAIIRLAQKSRAVGIHLVLATQRPSADIITGMIKANVPARIAFAVSSQTDSRVILDQNGAESLLGEGDMLFRPASESRLARIKGAFVTEAEIEELTERWRRQGEPELQEELLETVEAGEEDEPGEFDPDADDLLPDAIATVVQMGTASTSMLQRRLRIGYTRAGRLIDMMERRGAISGYEGSKARQVLITEADLPRVLAGLGDPAAGPAGGGGRGRAEAVVGAGDEPRLEG
jgi:S-DNA-T family DNA segregation ATPase FtsK/SpoIIIE